MDKDVLIFIKIVIVILVITAILIYFITRLQGNKYIIYADKTCLKKVNKKTLVWKDLNRILYQNKYVAGKGLQEMNYGIVFYFKNGKATINRKSNIYEEVYRFSQGLQVPKSSIITKGLMVVK